MKLFKKILLFVCFLPFVVNASTVEEQREALIETANAYHRQGVQVQYDSYKKNLYQTPEDATSQHYNYTVCSGFTFQSYYHTFGIVLPDTTEGLLDYAEANITNNLLVPLYKTSDAIYVDSFLGDSASNAVNLANEWINILKPGDIFVVTGHAMLIESVDVENNVVSVLESSFKSGEGRFDFVNHVDKFEKNGSIGKKDLVSILNYYFKSKVDRMAIIRIINDDQKYINSAGEEFKYEITNSAKTRMQYSKIDIEKTVEIENSKNNQSLFANLNDKLTYTITITNNSNSIYEDLIVVENIDSKTSVIDSGLGLEKDGTLLWEIPVINPNETYTIKYTLSVTKDKNSLGKVILATGKVNDIATSKIETLISTTINDDESKILNDNFELIKNNNLVESAFINELYKKSFNIDLGISNIQNNSILKYDSSIKEGGYDTLSVKTTNIVDENLKKYILQNFYGLRVGNTNVMDKNIVRASLQWNIFANIEMYDRARTLTDDMLVTGDILLVYTGDTSYSDENLVSKSYIYLDDKLVRKISTDEFEELSGDELNTFLANIVCDNYVMLRPALIFDRVFDENISVEDKVDNPNTKTNGIVLIIILVNIISIVLFVNFKKKYDY